MLLFELEHEPLGIRYLVCCEPIDSLSREYVQSELPGAEA